MCNIIDIIVKMCYSPIYLKKYDLSVPCGKCEQCLKVKARDWSTRVQSMAKDYRLYFFTLTYSEKFVPRNKYGDRIVSSEDITKFFKRFRINLARDYGKSHLFDSRGIKYILCSEYGPNSLRPHYHCILFVPKSFSVSANYLKDNVFRSWSRCLEVAFDFQCVGSDCESIKKVSNYLSKYLTLAKILPVQLYETCLAFARNHVRNRSSEFLDWYYSQECLNNFEERWFKFFQRKYYPSSFLRVSKGLGRDILSSALSNYYDSLFESCLKCINDSTFDDVPFLLHQMFIFRDGRDFYTLPKYIRERYKRLSPIGHHLPDLFKTLSSLGLLKSSHVDREFTCCISIYDSPLYISYKNNHHVLL
ncbi:replication initiator protein [Dipodfec virus UOA04_Rod_1109]|nr:replication initiator protein [Dipodfec virus UOA04_Rod_1109]